ncbi:hypothetical protein [Paraburkholderia youngii]|uniref:hypothetical protein n=1 Tax=Paraburkholderia youngii TaxID=2782701 RepID=UPI003D20E4C2
MQLLGMELERPTWRGVVGSALYALAIVALITLGYRAFDSHIEPVAALTFFFAFFWGAWSATLGIRFANGRRHKAVFFGILLGGILLITGVAFALGKP